MYSAMILLCLINKDVNVDNCLIMQSNIVYESEIECVESIAGLLNDEIFNYSYSYYTMKKFVCYEWLNSNETKI